MKKLLFLSLFLISSASAFAQHEVGTFSVQPRAGLNIADFWSLGEYDSRYGFAGGVEVEYQLTQKFSMSAGVLYSQQGARTDQGPIPGSSNPVYNWGANGKTVLDADYVNFPILANYYVAKGLALKLGVQPAYKIHSKCDRTISQPLMPSFYSLGYTLGDFKSFDVAIPVGLSYEYKNIVVDGRYNLGLLEVWGKGRNSFLQFTVGYKFCL